MCSTAVLNFVKAAILTMLSVAFCEIHHDINSFENCHILLYSIGHLDPSLTSTFHLIKHPIQLSHPEQYILKSTSSNASFNWRRAPPKLFSYQQILPDFQPLVTHSPLQCKLLVNMFGICFNYQKFVTHFLQQVKSIIPHLYFGNPPSVVYFRRLDRYVDIYSTYFALILCKILQSLMWKGFHSSKDKVCAFFGTRPPHKGSGSSYTHRKIRTDCFHSSHNLWGDLQL